MQKKSCETYFRENQKAIKKVCQVYSRYLNVDYEDLISLSHENFMYSYNKYEYEKIPFEKYMMQNLINCIKNHSKRTKWLKAKEEYIHFIEKNEYLIKNESIFNENFKKVYKNNINIKENIKKNSKRDNKFMFIP